MVDRMDPRGKIDRWRDWLAPESGFVTMVGNERAIALYRSAERPPAGPSTATYRFTSRGAGI